MEGCRAGGVALLLALLCGCAAQKERKAAFQALQAGAKSLCDVMADPGPHVGRRIVVKGVYFATPHERLLIDRDCPQRSLRVSHSLKVDGDPAAEAMVDRFRRKHPTVRVPVVYSGVVTARAVIHGCTKPVCQSYSLEESRLLGALARIAVPLGG